MSKKSGQVQRPLEERLAEFVYRCGRVLAVPLATNTDLLDTAHKMLLTGREDGGTDLTRIFPPEVELDALAARSRPLFLEKDRCGYKAGMGALRRLVRRSGSADVPDRLEVVEDLRKGWDEASDAARSRYLITQRGIAPGSEISTWQEHKLAEAWQYGDLIHADEGAQSVATRQERLMAGWQQQAQVVKVASSTVVLVRWLDEDLGLGIPSWAFDASDLPHGRVTVTTQQTYLGAEDAEGSEEELLAKLMDDPDAAPEAFTSIPLAPGESVEMTVMPPGSD